MPYLELWAKCKGQYAFSGHSAAEGRQISAENRQNAANISIFRLLGDLARQYQQGIALGFLCTIAVVEFWTLLWF